MKRMKKILSFLLAAALILNLTNISSMRVNAEENGTSGANAGTSRTVYFEKPEGWNNNLHIYCWYGNSDDEPLGEWPGVAMTAAEQSVGQNVYSYTFADGIDTKDLMLIFNDGNNGKQTDDLQFEGFNKIFTVTDPDKDRATGDWKDVDSSDYSKGDYSRRIPPFTGEKVADAYYGNATFYDYYSDYELTGQSRTKLDGSAENLNPSVTQQGKVLNKAISDYFEGEDIAPLYFGDFSSYSDRTSDQVKQELGLNNWSFYINNSANIEKNNHHLAVQDLIDRKLRDDKLTIGGMKAPYFNEAFLRGTNSRNAALGYVYDNVGFPFVKNAEGYWEFDSSKEEESLQLQQTSENTFILANTGKGVKGYSGGKETDNSNYFPFNSSDESGQPKRLNYMFGARVDIPFYLTDDKKIYDEEGNPRSTLFNFSGDDDVWIFIDGQLVLDIGGDHGEVAGQIDFTKGMAAVSGTKEKNGTVKREGTVGQFVTDTQNGITSEVEGKYTVNSFELTGDSNTEHTLTMFYMERGLWESNLKITFNFLERNTLEVDKEVEIGTVNEKLKEAVTDVLNNKKDFSFTVKNLATSGPALDGTGTSADPTVTFNEFNQDASGSVSGNEGVTVGIKPTVMSGHESVLSLKFNQEKNLNDDQKVTDSLCGDIQPVNSDGHIIAEGIDIIRAHKYLIFDAYYNGSSTSPTDLFVALTDNKGNRIGKWSSGLIENNSWNNNMAYHDWKPIKAVLDAMDCLDGNKEQFDYTHVTKVQIAYWEKDAEVYIDNIKFLPDESTQSPMNVNGGIRDYGSITSEKLEPAVGAAYTLSGETEGTVAGDGSMSLKNDQTAAFANQFRKGSYIAITENVDSDIFETTWTVSEDGTEQKKGTGTSIADGRLEKEASVEQPEPAILYRSYINPNSVNEPLNLQVKYTNTLKMGSVTIGKELQEGSTDDGREFSFTIEYMTFLGETLTDCSETFTLKAGKSKTIQNIPAGTVYKVSESLNGDDEELVSVKKEGESHKDVSANAAEASAAGNVREGNQTFIFVNKIEPDDPDQPDKPTGPDQPDRPDGPDQPDKPNGPDQPADPDQPGTPTSPDQPTSPTAPSQPTEPDNMGGDSHSSSHKGSAGSSSGSSGTGTITQVTVTASPGTGDSEQPLLYVILAAVCLAILTSAVVLERKKKRNRK